MRQVFCLFRGDLEDDDYRRVLLGSPGVRKSIACFLAALWKALHDSRPVVYLRKVKEEKRVSAFAMNRTAEGALDVHFSRRIKKYGHWKLLDEARQLMECFGVDDDSCYFLWMDHATMLQAISKRFTTTSAHPVVTLNQRVAKQGSCIFGSFQDGQAWRLWRVLMLLAVQLMKFAVLIAFAVVARGRCTSTWKRVQKADSKLRAN